MMDRRFIIGMIVIVFIWSTLIYTMLNKGHELSNHPCSLCAERQGETVYCSIGLADPPQHRAYHPNLSISNGTRTFILPES